MLIHRTDAEVAAAGHRDTRLMIPAEQGADQIIRGAHMLGQFIGHGKRIDRGGIDFKGMHIDDAHPRADLL